MAAVLTVARVAARLGRPPPSPAAARAWWYWAAGGKRMLQKEAGPPWWAGEKKSTDWAILFSPWTKDQPLGSCCLTNLRKAVFPLMLVGITLYTYQGENVHLINEKSLTVSHYIKRGLATHPSLFRRAPFPHREGLAWKQLEQMKNRKQLWKNCLYVCVDLMEKYTLRFKCLLDLLFFFTEEKRMNRTLKTKHAKKTSTQVRFQIELDFSGAIRWGAVPGFGSARLYLCASRHFRYI